MRFPRPLQCALLALAPSLLLTGCAIGYDATVTPEAGVASLGTINGIAHGGQQAIISSRVYVYETGDTAYGGAGITAAAGNASKSLLNSAGNTTKDGSNNYFVTTINDGEFTITGDYTCDSGRTVYLYVTGGNPGLAGGTNNSAIGELAMLGVCPSQGGNLAATTPFVYVNEVSTVAAAYALAGFATDATHISNAGSSLAQTAITNTAGTAFNLENIATGAACSSVNCASTNPSGASGTVPASEINTLANIIAACINTTGPTSSQCTTLFSNATNDGATCTSSCTDHPTDTASAMINIAHFPAAGTSNPNHISNLYSLQSGFTAFVTHLSAQPNDFTLQVVYSGGGLVPMFFENQGMESDASGNIWIAQGQAPGNNGNSGDTISKFNYLGKPVSSTGIVNASLNIPNSLAIDATSANVWIANYSNNNLAKYNISGGTFSFVSTGANTGPAVVSIDGANPANVWAAGIPQDTGTGFYSVFKVNSSTNALTTIQGGNDTHESPANGILSPTGIGAAGGSAGNIWVANSQGNDGVSVLANTNGAFVNSVAYTTINQPDGPAFDASGNAWFIAIKSAYKVSPTTYAATGYDVPLTPPFNLVGVETDGASNVWISTADLGATTAQAGNAICEFSSGGANLAGNTCFTPVSTITQPDSLTLDISGNVWYTSNNDSTLTEMIGAGAPAYMPLSAARANNKLGARP